MEFDFTSSEGPWTGTHHGRGRLIESFDSLGEAFDHLRWELRSHRRRRHRNRPVRFYTRGRESGIETTTRAVQVYRFKDGKVVRYQLRASRADAQEAMGRAE